MSAVERCPFAIKFGTTLHTRCLHEAGHLDVRDGGLFHVGRGLAEFDYQRIQWLPGDRREYRTEREDEFAWEGSTA